MYVTGRSRQGGGARKENLLELDVKKNSGRPAGSGAPLSCLVMCVGKVPDRVKKKSNEIRGPGTEQAGAAGGFT